MNPNEQKHKTLKEATDSLKRIQDFNPESIARVEDLGRDLNFQDGVSAASKLVELFRQVSLDIVNELSASRLQSLKQSADAEYNRLQQILKFSATDQNPKQTRDSLLQQLENAYDQVFEQIWPAVAYSVRRSTDFARMEREARSVIQNIQDKTDTLKSDLEKKRKDADAALDAIRKVAAEQGVSQQAIYFKEEADKHSDAAIRWFKVTTGITILTCLYAIFSVFVHKISWIAPNSTYETIQIGISKLMVFAALGFYLVLAARNYMAHRHNAVVNKHRQNSLVTYRAIVEAAAENSNRDIVLAKAADTIFCTQPTGFSRNESDDSRMLSMVNLTSPILKQSGGN
jgi:type II secretory pathway pseudopilin PulG